MENIVFGVLCILICSIGYFYSWKHYKQDNYTIAVLLLMLSGFGLLVFTSADFYLHTWDERYHALVAKNFIKHPLTPTLYDNPVLPFDYKIWIGNHIWLHKQPLSLWSIAASMWLFGVNEIALRLPSIILTTMGIWLTFSIGKYFFSKQVGYFAAFLFSINGLIIELTAGRVATDHVDIFFMFFILLSVYLSIKYVQKRKTIYNVFVGLSIGTAILSKWLPALIVLPIWLLLVWDSGYFTLKKTILQFSILLLVIIAVFLPWQLYIFSAFPLEANWESSFNFKHFTEVIEERAGPFYYFLNRIRINFGDLIYLPLFWFLWKTLKNVRDKKRLAISIWFLVPLFVFSVAKTKMQGYMLFSAPALFLMTSEFFFMLNDYKKGHQLKWLFNIVLVLLVALPIRYGIERIKPFTLRDRNPQWVIDLRNLHKEKTQKGILFNYNRPIEAMFYTDLTVYSKTPEKDVIIDLIKKGHTIIINNDGQIPQKIMEIEGVVNIKLTTAETK